MRSFSKSARAERQLFRHLRKELTGVCGVDGSPTPSRHRAKDALGVIVTLALIGAFLLQMTDGLASQCGPGLDKGTPGECSGIAAIADHSQHAVTLIVCISAAIAVVTFIWYLGWGYKTKTKG